MEYLHYWNLRAVEARIEYGNSGKKIDREKLLLARRVVSLIEDRLFNRKDVK